MRRLLKKLLAKLVQHGLKELEKERANKLGGVAFKDRPFPFADSPGQTPPPPPTRQPPGPF